MADILNIFNSIPLTNNILWQYENAPNLKNLIQSKQNWYNTNNEQFYQSLIDNFLNILTANDWGLGLWGVILQVPRTYTVNGEEITLDRERYRKVLRAKMLLIRMNGTIPEIIKYINFLLGEYGQIDVIDNLNMTITYRFNFNLSDLQIAILKTTGLLAAPAGVRANVVSLDNTVFGFNGSGGQPFNQGRFANYLDF